MLNDREGVVLIAFGTAVTVAGLALKPLLRCLPWVITGFGLANISLGTVGLMKHRYHRKEFC